MEKKAKISITIDGRELMVDQGSTILEAAREHGISIPTLCHHPAVSNWGGCRLCVVEVDHAPRLAASCVTPVRPGMEVVTTNERILESRRIVLEYLFAERNHNCMICAQSGDCELQKLAYEMQMDHLSVPFSFQSFATDVTSEYMVLDHNRCILCGRCVRACAELAGNYVLNFQNRGPRSLVGLDLNDTREASSCFECGICMQLCPTGAITSRYRSHYAVKGHSGEWQEVETVCPHCGLLCPTVERVKDDHLLRVDGKISGGNGRPDKGQLCYRGRFEVLKEERRLLRPMVRDGDGEWKEEGWGETLGLVGVKLSDLKGRYGGGGLFGLASASLSNEELLLFKDLMQGCWGAGYVDTLDGHYYRAIVQGLGAAGVSWKEASWREIPDADFVLVAGGNPYVSQPLIASLLRKGMLEKGHEVAVVGDADRLMPLTAYELPGRRAGETRWMDALYHAARAGMKKGSGSDGDEILSGLGLDTVERETFSRIVEAFVKSRNPLVIAGEALAEGDGGLGVRRAVELSGLKGRLPDGSLRVLFLKPGGNSSGAWRLGVPAREGRGSSAQWRGGIMVLGGCGDPFPSGLEGLDGVEFLVVVTPYVTEEMRQKAHVLIPKPSCLEGEGSFTSLDGRETAYRRRTLEPSDGLKDSWEILLELGNGSGSPMEIKGLEELRARAERAILSVDLA
ncbi:MAG: (2Fe-2S)-binding protein [Deltaproteobacteria bacterium]|nr:(2Fe-2S)-binding protein [Deltaproteobacteria bacterium]